ncbi:MAG: hypothetical protein IH958_03720, partial [Chloroflexi bacterium]|nr:hypothetical protein [Chloroflexota bacterium]
MTPTTAGRLSRDDLHRELTEYRERYPKLADDELFVLWFLRAYVAESDAEAAAALCGGPRDKDADAVLIDERERLVFVIQGKYREEIAAKNEHRGDVMGFAQLAVNLCGDKKTFDSLAAEMAPEVHQKLKEGRDRVLQRGYKLRMFYVTLGKCSRALLNEAERTVRRADDHAAFELFDGKRVLLLLHDYLDGVAPPVPSLDLDIEARAVAEEAGGVKGLAYRDLQLPVVDDGG